MTLQEINEINRKAIASDYLDMRTRVSRIDTVKELNYFIHNYFGVAESIFGIRKFTAIILPRKL